MFECCDQMKYYLDFTCGEHESPMDCPDSLVIHDGQFDEFGLIIHDGSDSYVQIRYCPWCGAKLPESRREKWFEDLEAKGERGPVEEIAPKKFHFNR